MNEAFERLRKYQNVSKLDRTMSYGTLLLIDCGAMRAADEKIET